MLNVSKGFHNVISVHRLAKYMTTSMSSIPEGYLSVHVKGRISPGAASSEIFYKNTIQNAKQSILEDGISRFDVLNRIDNNDEFLLIEVYNSANGPGDHKLTSHYNSWRENVADLMAEPRSAAKYTTLFPPKSNWKTDATASTTDDDSFMKKIPWNSDPFVNSLNSGDCYGLNLTHYVVSVVTCSLCLSICLFAYMSLHLSIYVKDKRSTCPLSVMQLMKS
jgi:autoinducer 2-degrading protein